MIKTPRGAPSETPGRLRALRVACCGLRVVCWVRCVLCVCVFVCVFDKATLPLVLALISHVLTESCVRPLVCVLCRCCCVIYPC
jgi:hypothetical protein